MGYQTNQEFSLKPQMTRLKLSYFRHIMQTKTLLFRKGFSAEEEDDQKQSGWTQLQGSECIIGRPQRPGEGRIIMEIIYLCDP